MGDVALVKLQGVRVVEQPEVSKATEGACPHNITRPLGGKLAGKTRCRRCGQDMAAKATKQVKPHVRAGKPVRGYTQGYQPKTGAACSCKPGVMRDNCSNCEGTGQVIDFAAIRARRPVFSVRYSERGFPLGPDDDELSWDVGAHHTLNEERAGYPRARTVIRAMQEKRPEQLRAVRADYVKGSFDRLFGHVSKKMLDIIDEETEGTLRSPSAAKAVINIGPHVRSGHAIRAYSQHRQGGLFTPGGSGEASSEAKITASAEYGAPDNSTFRDATGYTVTLRYQGRKMKTPFYMGAALTKEPTAHDVMMCLASDAASYEQANGSFEEWAREYGYETEDSEAQRRAKKVFRAVEKQTEKLKALLGDDFEKIAYADEDELKQFCEGASSESASKSTPAQQDKIHRVMHEFKHGELHSGSKKGPKVRKRKQAIAIALSEAGQSRKTVALTVGGGHNPQA